ncbi:MAG: hypothetical protein ABI390_09795 [Daejeonella sp.]
MKSLILILLFPISLQSLQSKDIESIELTLRTRGSSKVIRVSSENTSTEVNGETKKVKTSDREWKLLLENLKGIELNRLATYSSKPGKSQVDASYIAQVCIRTKNESYESSSFDESNPPQQLRELVAHLSNILKKQE